MNNIVQIQKNQSHVVTASYVAAKVEEFRAIDREMKALAKIHAAAKKIVIDLIPEPLHKMPTSIVNESGFEIANYRLDQFPTFDKDKFIFDFGNESYDSYCKISNRLVFNLK